MNRLRVLWSRLGSSFWFLLSAIVAASIVLAVVLVDTDSSDIQYWMAGWPRLFGAGAEGARQMLATIAGSMMTVVGVTFSMTLMTLALASSQYTSRILRNFMSDRITQVVLGIFAGIFTYCLIVLRTIRDSDENTFIPSLAVSFGVVLAIGGIGVLIYFIHHIASSIQASNIIASVAAETIAVVERLFPQHLGDEPKINNSQPSALPETLWHPVLAGKNGYIQYVDSESLLRVAKKHNSIIRIERGIGEFVTGKSVLASIAGINAPLPASCVEIAAAYTIDRHRTVEQDAAFGIRQIVDMALRALSPSVNDTTTAIVCVDYLSAILTEIANRDIPSSYRFIDGELRVIAAEPTFEGLINEAFNQIRSNAKQNYEVLLRLLDALQTIGAQNKNSDRLQVLREQADRIVVFLEDNFGAQWERQYWGGCVSRVRESFLPT